MEELLRFMAHVERQVEKEDGWDKPPKLFGLTQSEDTFAAEQLPVNFGSLDEDELMEFAQDFVRMAPQAAEARPDFFGFMFLHEAWGAPDEAVELKPYQTYADVPGGKEIRGMCAVTVEGEAIYLFRARGEADYRAVDAEIQADAILTMLLTVVLAIAPFTPAKPEAVQELKDLLARVTA